MSGGNASDIDRFVVSTAMLAGNLARIRQSQHRSRDPQPPPSSATVAVAAAPPGDTDEELQAMTVLERARRFGGTVHVSSSSSSSESKKPALQYSESHASLYSSFADADLAAAGDDATGGAADRRAAEGYSLLHPPFAAGADGARSKKAAARAASARLLGRIRAALPIASASATTFAPAFDASGALTGVATTGVALLPLHAREWYVTLTQRLGWSTLMLLLAALYFCAGFILALLYYVAGYACGANVSKDFNIFIAVYFQTVSLAANGGYLGEPEIMVDSSTKCYEYRTYIVWLASFWNVVLVGGMAAVVATKISSTRLLRSRIVFSDVCVVRDIPPAAPSTTSVAAARRAHGSLAAEAFSTLAKRKNATGDAALAPPPAAAASHAAPTRYALQLRVANLDQTISSRVAGGCGVLSGTLRLFLVVLEGKIGTGSAANPTSIRPRTYELPWVTQDETHDDDGDDDDGGELKNSSRSLRLWFPATATVVVDPHCTTKAVRILHALLDSSAAAPPSSLIKNVVDFQIVAEYIATDANLGGSAFVSRRAFGASALLRRFRFSGSPVQLSFAQNAAPGAASGLTVDYADFNCVVQDSS